MPPLVLNSQGIKSIICSRSSPSLAGTPAAPLWRGQIQSSRTTTPLSSPHSPASRPGLHRHQGPSERRRRRIPAPHPRRRRPHWNPNQWASSPFLLHHRIQIWWLRFYETPNRYPLFWTTDALKLQRLKTWIRPKRYRPIRSSHVLASDLNRDSIRFWSQIWTQSLEIISFDL
jgi:hypothetical protein